MLAANYADSGMYKEAIESAKEAIRLKSDYSKAYVILGLAYLPLGMYQESIDSLNKAIRINPYDEYAFYRLGAIYAGLGISSEAIKAYKQAINIKPDYTAAHFMLGIEYSTSGNDNAAMEEYKIVKKLDSNMANRFFDVSNDLKDSKTKDKEDEGEDRRWKRFGNGRVLYDSKSITYPAKNIVGVWIKAIYADTNTNTHSNLKEGRIFREIDCSKRMHRELSFIFIYRNEKRESDHQPSKWIPIAPKSGGENLYRIVCK